MSKEIETIRVYGVNLNSKYVLVFDQYIPDKEFEKLKSDIRAWLAKDETFLILRSCGEGVIFEKIEDE